MTELSFSFSHILTTTDLIDRQTFNFNISDKSRYILITSKLLTTANLILILHFEENLITNLLNLNKLVLAISQKSIMQHKFQSIFHFITFFNFCDDVKTKSCLKFAEN